MFTAGVTVGDPVLRTGKPLSVELGPGKMLTEYGFEKKKKKKKNWSMQGQLAHTSPHYNVHEVKGLNNRCSYMGHFYCGKLPFYHEKLHFVHDQHFLR